VPRKKSAHRRPGTHHRNALAAVGVAQPRHRRRGGDGSLARRQGADV